MKMKYRDSPIPSIIALIITVALFIWFMVALVDFFPKTAPTQEVSSTVTATPTATPSEHPTSTPTPEITPTTVTIELAPIVARRTFKITAYAICMECCGKTDGIGYGGAKVEEGVSIAADLSVLPLGTVVDIEGIGLRTVQDKGSHVIGNHIDLLLGSYEEALEFGVQYKMVTIFEIEK